jgi:hypothetical protein
MQKDMVIEVACLVDFEELDQEDRNEQGECSVDGSYGLTLTEVPEGASRNDIIEATSLQFHRHVAIACLDDFDIYYRDRSAHDVGMHELGEYPFEREDAPEIS